MIYIVWQEDFDLLKSSDKLECVGVTVRYCSRREEDGNLRQYIATDAPLTKEDCNHIRLHSDFFVELGSDQEFQNWLNEFNPSYKPNSNFRFAMSVEDIPATLDHQESFSEFSLV